MVELSWCQNLGEVASLVEGRVSLRHWKFKENQKKDPAQNPWLLWVHGWGEHSGRYNEFANYLGHFGLADIVAPDLPGYGRSRAEGGCKRLLGLDEQVLVLKQILGQMAGKGGLFENRPLFLGGHSMGSLICLDLIRGGLPPGVSCQRAFFSSVSFEIAVPIPTYKQKALDFLNVVNKDFSFPNGELVTSQVSYDCANVGEYDGDPWMHGLVSARWLNSMRETSARICKEASKFSTPLSIACGGDDPTISIKAQEDFFNSLPASLNKRFLKIPQAKHEILFDINRERLFRSVVSWFL